MFSVGQNGKNYNAATITDVSLPPKSNIGANDVKGSGDRISDTGEEQGLCPVNSEVISCKDFTDQKLMELREHFTDKEAFYHFHDGDRRLVIVLDADHAIDNETCRLLEQIVNVRNFADHVYYVNSVYPIIVKLDNMLCFTGVREKYREKSSKLISFDSRLVRKKGEKHLGLLSLLHKLAEIGINNNIGLLRKKLGYVEEVLRSDDKLRWYGGAKIRVKPCSPLHATCIDCWKDDDEQNRSIKANCALTVEARDGTKRYVTPLCLFARKIVTLKSPMQTSQLPAGLFAMPVQFDKKSELYSKALSKGLRPFSYDLEQLENLGEGDQKLLQCAVKPHYKAMWRKSVEDFKSSELVHGTYKLAGFYLESSEKMSLQLEVMDELISCNTRRPTARIEMHEGSYIFNRDMYMNMASYSDDENELDEFQDEDEQRTLNGEFASSISEDRNLLKSNDRESSNVCLPLSSCKHEPSDVSTFYADERRNSEQHDTTLVNYINTDYKNDKAPNLQTKYNGSFGNTNNGDRKSYHEAGTIVNGEVEFCDQKMLGTNMTDDTKRVSTIKIRKKLFCPDNELPENKTSLDADKIEPERKKARSNKPKPLAK